MRAPKDSFATVIGDDRPKCTKIDAGYGSARKRLKLIVWPKIVVEGVEKQRLREWPVFMGALFFKHSGASHHG